MLTALMLMLLQVASATDSGAAFTLPSGVMVRIVELPFKASEWRIEGCGTPQTACRINGHLPFGVDRGLPGTYVKSITVEFKGQRHALDASGMFNAWGGRPLEYKGVVRYFGGRCFEPRNCHFRGLFSDGAGSFVAEWQVVNDHVLRTVLTDSIDVVHLFASNIDPPEYE